MKKLTTLITLLFFTVTTFSQKKMETFEKNGFSINYPVKWTKNDSGQMGTQVIFFSEIEPNDTFRENVNVLIQDLKGQNFTLETYKRTTMQQIKTMVSDHVIEKNETMKAKGEEYHVLIWSGTVSGNKLKFKQHSYVKDEKAYVVTYTSTPEGYAKHFAIADSMIKSFKIQ